MTTDAAELPTTADRRRLLVDLASSYALSIARVASMAAAIAIFFRSADAAYAATFILIRTMLGVLTYAFSGFAPATQQAIAAQSRVALPIAAVDDSHGGATLPYRANVPIAGRAAFEDTRIGANASVASLLMALLALALVLAYGRLFTAIHDVAILTTYLVSGFVFLYGVGMLARLAAEPASAVLQSRGQLALDNLILIVAEIAWPVLLWMSGPYVTRGEFFESAGVSFAAIGVAAGLSRMLAATAALVDGRDTSGMLDPQLARTLWRRSIVISTASFADFLYAPFNLMLISAAIAPAAVADYTPALQFDGALLLLVGAIAATMLPRAMRLAGEHRVRELRTLYLRSTLVSLAILAIAAIATWLAAPTILRLWLGQPMPATLAVLPFVLLHTVIGGTAGVGRATLLAMGRFRAYTVSAIVGGVANVALALLFVVGLGWGLRGVALATVVAVFGRCALWMPWYILRALRDDRLIELIEPTAVRSDPNVGQVP